MLKILKFAYGHCPGPIKQLYGVVPIPSRMGRAYRHTRRLLHATQRWPHVKLEDYQREQVYQLLCHAYDNVPYYRKIFHELGIRATDLSEPLEFLSTFPTLTREVVKRHQTDLLARSIPWYARHVLSSGGTTGEP